MPELLPGSSQPPATSLVQGRSSIEKQRSLHRSHSLEDLSALAQQRLQVGIAQGPVEAVPVSFGLSDRGESFAEFLKGEGDTWGLAAARALV